MNNADCFGFFGDMILNQIIVNLESIRFGFN